jgi:NADH-quinone oxidoreductase subunit G
MVKQGGEWREVEWNVALDYVAHGLKDISREHGGDALAALASANSTLEELALLARVMKGLGSGNIDFRARQSDFSSDGKKSGTPWLGMRIAEIADLDAALVVGSFLRKDHPLLAQRLRSAAKHYTKVSEIAVSADDQLVNFHARLTVAPAALAATLGAVVRAAAEIKGVAIPSGLEGVEVCDVARAIAGSLLEGEKSAIFLGNAAVQSPSATQLHLLANELAAITGATVGFLGEAANSVGAHVAGALPSGANAGRMFDEPRKGYVLLGIEPEFDIANPHKAVAALRQAGLVVFMSSFKHQPALEYADVMLPIAPFAETSGTFVNAEGRVQSFNGVVKPRGDARPAWKILRVLGNVLNLNGFSQESSEQVRDEILGKDVEFCAGLDNGLKGLALALPQQPVGLQRIADVPVNFSDAAVRRAPALQRTADAAAPTARMNPLTLSDLGIETGSRVRVRQGQGDAVLEAVADVRIPQGCVRVSAAHASTAGLGDMFGSISVERA